MAIKKFSDIPNQGITVLNGALSDSATTIPVDSMADLKLTGLTGTDFAYCKITKQENWRQHPINRKESFEIIKVTAVSANDLTATRGVDGTSGTTFANGDIVEVIFSSIHYQDLVDAITDGTAELNIGALTVGTVGIGTTSPVTMLNLQGGSLLLENDVNDFLLGSKRDSQGDLLSGRGPSDIFIQGVADERPEISWFRGSRDYPEFAIRQHTTSDRGGEIYSGDGVGAPILTMVFDSGDVFVPSGDVEITAGELGIGNAPTIKLDVNAKGGITDIGGHTIKLTNKTGGTTVKGQLVIASTSTADAFETAGVSEDRVIGIVLDSGVGDGSEAWIVVAGFALVKMDSGGAGIGDRIISSATAGTGLVSNSPAAAVHLQEIGHSVSTVAGGGLAKCVIHFN